MPLRLDSYHGCGFNCQYCFSKSLNNRDSNFHRSKGIADVEKIAALFKSSFESSGVLGPVRSSIKHRLPIHFGSTSDPFQHRELKHGITSKLLRLLASYNYPFILSTKAKLPADKDYIDYFKNSPSGVQISFSTFDESLAKKLEISVPSVSERLSTLETLASNNVWTAVRLQPYLFPFSDFGEEEIKTLSNAGAKHIILEHLRIPTNSSSAYKSNLSTALSCDIMSVLRDHGMKRSRISYEYVSEVKLANILRIRNLAHSNGLTFGCGDNDFHYLSDEISCCGKPDYNEFNNLYTGHFGSVLHGHPQNEEINFENIDNSWHPSGSIREFINSDSRKATTARTMKEFLHFKIGSPGKSNAPDSFYGVEHIGNNQYIYRQKGGNEQHG